MNKGSYSEPVNTRRCSQVEDQCEALDHALSDLFCLVDSLDARLAQVTRFCEVAPTNPEPPEERLVPLADSVRSFKKRVASANERLSDILGRIEL